MKIIVIENEKEVLNALKNGVVQGRLSMSSHGMHKSVIVFKAYNRKPRTYLADKLVEKLPWGWVKESARRLKRHTSIPKDLTFAQKLAILDQENKLAKEALMKHELFNTNA